MKINYNILWVEDDQSWYDTTLELFKETLDDQGFELIPQRCDNIEEVRLFIEQDGLKRYDILLIDFTLKNSDSGDEIIKLIRDNSIYTDVLFYSSAVENVTDSMRKYGLEGVYTADRKEIETKFEIVFNTTIKKIQEINSMRGLIVGETSDLDVLIEKLTLHIVGNVSKLEKDKLDEIINFYVEDFLKKSPNTFLKKYEEYGFLNWFHKIEASRKWSIFRDLLKTCPLKDEPEIKSFLKINKEYSTEVISIRNKFAHSKAEEKDGKLVLIAQLGQDDFEYDDAKFIEIRSNLKKHRKSFESIFQKLGYTNS